MNTIHELLLKHCKDLLPRILTQVCRDPNAFEYGSFDRNWWHYKIRDFSSIILQQGGYTLFCASTLPEYAGSSQSLIEIAEASAKFWNQRSQSFRAYEEYYPWEQGYPPLAFSTLAVAKLVDKGIVSLNDVQPGLKQAVNQLEKRFEPEAINQQIAGLAALSIIRKIDKKLVDEDVFNEILYKTLSYQDEEGWFHEYGGPDLGYLSVSLDCLWDIYDATADPDVEKSAHRAFDFIYRMTISDHLKIGMHNSRNTDYIVPYGICRFLEIEKSAEKASYVLNALYRDLDNEEHFLKAVDDRYYCHYIGHSLFRAIPYIKNGISIFDRTYSGSEYLSNSGYYLYKDDNSENCGIVSTKKGGIFTFYINNINISDYGWLLFKDSKIYTTHWWGDFWEQTIGHKQIKVKGHFVLTHSNVSSPFKHIVLRTLSLLLGSRIISVLKKRMIFNEKKKIKLIEFERTISWTDNVISVIDSFDLPSYTEFQRAPRSSKRHVASADSYHREDFSLCSTGISVNEEIVRETDRVKICTIYEVK